jgi:predicted nuclease of predicted toxin-antitoxin system
MARLLADENFPRPVVEALRALGHDVVTVQEMGLGDSSVTDGAILERASAEQRALVTLDRRDFIALHHVRPSHAGIIACNFDLDFLAQAARIDRAIEERVLRGQLIRVNRPP